MLYMLCYISAFSHDLAPGRSIRRAFLRIPYYVTLYEKVTDMLCKRLVGNERGSKREQKSEHWHADNYCPFANNHVVLDQSVRDHYSNKIQIQISQNIGIVLVTQSSQLSDHLIQIFIVPYVCAHLIHGRPTFALVSTRPALSIHWYLIFHVYTIDCIDSMASLSHVQYTGEKSRPLK